MREILFRGKRTDNGEWVVGDSLVHSMYKKGDVCIGVIEGLAIYSVIPETVGQYTGLTDKNGTKIFEGDIVKTHSGLLGKIKFGTFFDYEFECDVQGYFWIGKYDEEDYRLALSDFWGGHEVIGNVFDNKDLLEG